MRWLVLLCACWSLAAWAEAEAEGEGPAPQDESEEADEGSVDPDDPKAVRRAARKARREARAKKEKTLRWYVLPSVAFDTDDGFGFGARGEIQFLKEGYYPYKASFVLQAYLTLKGYHNHRFFMDFPGFGPKNMFRLVVRLAYRQWLNDGYWGVGNGTYRERQFLGSFDRDDPARKRYRYYLIQPFGFVSLRIGHRRPVQAYASLRFQYSIVNLYEGSLLAEHQPEGVPGGFEAEISGGVLIDTRDSEFVPEKGTYTEIGFRASPDLMGNGHEYLAPFGSTRWYIGIAPRRFVFAFRVMAEYLIGTPPLYETQRWASAVPIPGMGGWATLRGSPFGRFRAPGRMVSNFEWRVDLFEIKKVLGAPLRLQLVPFVDVGAVFGAGDAATAPPPDFPLHPSVGGGVHVVWDDSFVARVDAAVSPDLVLEEDGTLQRQPYFGFFFVFDQHF